MIEKLRKEGELRYFLVLNNEYTGMGTLIRGFHISNFDTVNIIPTLRNMWLCQYKILVTYQDLNSLPQDLNITIYDHHQCIPNHDFKNWEIQITGYITYGDSISQPSLLKEKCLLTIPSQHYSYQTRIHSKISSHLWSIFFDGQIDIILLYQYKTK